MRVIFKQALCVSLIVCLLAASLGLSPAAPATAAIPEHAAVKREPLKSAQQDRQAMQQRHRIHDDVIQAHLDKGYTLPEVQQALEQASQTGLELEESLRRVKPEIVNLSAQAESLIINELDEPSAQAKGQARILSSVDIALNNVNTRPNEAPYSVRLEAETVSTLSGSLSVQATEFILPGRGGLSFALVRQYDAGSAQFYQMDAVGGNNAATEPTSEEKRFPIGKGWSWNLSFIETKQDKQYLHLAGQGVYEIRQNNLIGYPWQDLTFGPDTTVTVNGETSAYVLSSIQGIRHYFNEDGYLIQISDPYGNYIHFHYGHNLLYGTVLQAIHDPIGNAITLTYTSEKVLLQYGTETITYITTHEAGKKLLTQVWDPLGRATTYDYTLKTAQFNLFAITPEKENPYALLTGVTHPTGAKTVYTYENDPVTRYVAETAVNQAYRISGRKDQITYSDATTEDVNAKTITYTGDISAFYGSTTTYFSTTIEGEWTATTFDNKKQFTAVDSPPVYYNTRVTTTAGAQQRVTDYTYDEARRWPWLPIQTTSKVMEGANESDPVTVLRTYNDDGNLLAETNSLGVTTTYTYDPSTRLLQSVTRPMGTNRTQYVAYERNAQGSVTREVVRETNSSGAVLQDVRYENYDTYGNPQTTRILDIGREIVWGMAYDALHQHAFLTEQTVQVKDVNNNTSTITQQAAYHLGSGRMTAYTDGKQQTTAYAYDALGRIVQATHPDQSTVTLRYDDYGNRLRIVDEAKIVAITTWNPVGWKLEEGIEEAGTYKAKAKYGYDSGGRLIWSEDAIGNRTEYAYDAWGRLTEITYADGFSTTTVYQDLVNIVATTDPEQNTFRETFDKLGRLVKREEVKPGLTIEHAVFTYDHAGNILTAKDAKGYITTYHYDTLGRLTGVTNPKQEQTHYSYDRLGNLTAITYADQNTLQKRYDELGRLIQRTDPKGNVDKYFYDANHNLVQRIDRKGQTFTFVYSNRDFLVQKISQDETIGFGYDAAGKRTHMTDATGTTQYAYQPYTGQLRQVTYPDGRSITYDYNPNGQRQQMTDPFGGNVYYHYDERNRLLGVGASPDLTQADATYSYYKNGLLQHITQKNGVTTSYGYNGLRLETLTHRKADNSLLNQYLYSYDLNGNQTSKTENSISYTYTYDELNRIATSEPFDETYTYDARGNRSALEQTKPLNLSNLQATYDDRDRLTSVTVDGKTVQYRYNGDNLLVERIENGVTTRYYYDGAQIIAEATVVGGTAQLKARYIRGRGLVAVEDAHLSKAYYLHNGHGDVVELRDPTGTTRLNTYTYDIWGSPMQEQAGVHNPFRYSGELWDDTTQLQYLRARWYDPSEGRFMNEDPYEGDIANPLSLNLFTYVHNNPVFCFLRGELKNVGISNKSA